ncbi:MAG: TrkA family potassium uptake protein [Myxococcales bacterium]|nr:TrkA family potassium uptake protein [Myxococcales bacterium]
MIKQALVVGLGQFGMSLARALATRGVEVLAVDLREERLRVAASFADETAAFDATDADALARTSPERRDVCVCAIGDEAKEASIICTALLRQMGAERVIARANDDVHARILRLVGAHEVVNPEREFGERFATRMVYDRVIGELPLGDDLLVTELRPPEAFVGRSLKDLQLPAKYAITVVAVRYKGKEMVLAPDPLRPLEAEDVLLVVSKEGAVGKVMKRDRD